MRTSIPRSANIKLASVATDVFGVSGRLMLRALIEGKASPREMAELGNNESGGKRRSGRIPRGNVHLKTALVEAANSAAWAKATYLRDKFYRVKARRGYKRAAVTVAHKILVASYYMLSHQVNYNELGDLYLDKLNKHHLKRNLVRRLERLGYRVTVEQSEAA